MLKEFLVPGEISERVWKHWKYFGRNSCWNLSRYSWRNSWSYILTGLNIAFYVKNFLFASDKTSYYSEAQNINNDLSLDLSNDANLLYYHFFLFFRRLTPRCRWKLLLERKCSFAEVRTSLKTSDFYLFSF